MGLYRNENVEKILQDNPFMEQTYDYNPGTKTPVTHTSICTGAYIPETPVAIAAGYNAGRFLIKSIGSIIEEYGDHDLPIYGASVIEVPSLLVGVTKQTTKVASAMMYAVPKKVPMPRTIGIGFSNGLTLKCSPTSGIMKRDGDYLKANAIKVGDKVLGYEYTVGSDRIEPTEYLVTKVVSETSLSAVGCLFVSMTGNLFVPKVEDDKYCFIVIQQ